MNLQLVLEQLLNGAQLGVTLFLMAAVPLSVNRSINTCSALSRNGL